MKKKKTNKEKSPRIYRIFTDWKVWVGIVSAFLIVGIGLMGLQLYKNLLTKADVEQKRQTAKLEIAFWKDIVSKYKDYRDGYFTIAVLEYKLGNKEKSKMYLQKTLELDPNFKNGRDLEKLLSK